MGQLRAFNELVARLAAAKVENEVLRQSLIPPLGTDSLGRLMTEQVLYAWMGILVASLKEFSDKDPEWASHPMAQSMWQVINEEIRAQRQGRNSAPQASATGPQQHGQLVIGGGGGQVGGGIWILEVVSSADRKVTGRHHVM